MAFLSRMLGTGKGWLLLIQEDKQQRDTHRVHEAGCLSWCRTSSLHHHCLWSFVCSALLHNSVGHLQKSYQPSFNTDN